MWRLCEYQSICLTMSNVAKYEEIVKKKRANEARWKLFASHSIWTTISRFSFSIFIIHSLHKQKDCKWKNSFCIIYNTLFVEIQRWIFVWNGNQAKICCQIRWRRKTQKDEERKNEFLYHIMWKQRKICTKMPTAIKIAQVTELRQFATSKVDKF